MKSNYVLQSYNGGQVKIMIYTFPSGASYEGDMEDDFFEGTGTFRFANGDVYNGGFQKDMFEGYGEYKYENGSVYKGFFSKDMFHGNGTFWYQDKSIEKGKFYQDKRVGKFYQIDTTSNQCNEVLYQNDLCINSHTVNAENISCEKLP